MKKILTTLIIILTFFINFNIISANEKYKVKLNKCVDGDTAWFNLNGENIKARFLAINTKESTNKIEKYGKEASNFTCKYLSDAKLIEIEYDINSIKFDKYERHLVWVFVDEKLLQDLLVKEGLAEIKYIYGNYKYLETLKNSENYAKKNKLNIYSDTNYIKIFNYNIDKNIFVSIICILSISILYLVSPKNKKKIIKYIKIIFKKIYKI